MSAPEFNTRDAATAAFWSERYARAFTPWEQGGVPLALSRAIAAAAARATLHAWGEVPHAPAAVLVPGCGSGHEIVALTLAGYKVLAIDIAPEAVALAQAHALVHAREQLAREGCHISAQDFFAVAARSEHAGRYAWIYERAFACALPPRTWPQWAAAIAILVAPGGVLAGLFMVDHDAPAAREERRGPPFAMRMQDLHDLLDEHFVLECDEPVPDDESIAVFRGKERWMAWRRK